MGTAIQPGQKHVQHDGTPSKHEQIHVGSDGIPSESPQGATKPDTSAQVFTMFNADVRAKYIEGLKKTYLGVLLSTELNDKNSKIEDVKGQIEALIKNTGSAGEINGKIKVDEKEANVTLIKKGDDVYNVKIDANSPEITIKNTGEYNTEDILALCVQHELVMSKDKKGNNVFSVTIKGIDNGKDTTIGGPGKISIFTDHLSYIKDTIEHLDEDKNRNPTKEFALATGTGKTFIELILEYLPARLIGTRYVSVAPNEGLIKQKYDDWKLFLSDGDINDIELDTISDEKRCSILTTQGLINNWNQFLKAVGLEELPGIIDALKIGDEKFEIKNGKINVSGKDFVILADKIQLGDQEYKIENGKVKIHGQEFALNVKKSVFATFDEEHRIVFEELYKGCMGFVSILCKTLFLSATPSAEIYSYVKEVNGLLKTLSLMKKMKSDAFGNLALNVYDTEEGDHVYSHTKKLAESVTFKTKKLKNDKDGKDDPFYYTPNIERTGEALREEIETYIFNNVESAIGKSALFSIEISELKDKLKDEVTHDIFTGKSTSGNHSSIVEEKRSKIIEHLIREYRSHNSAVIEQVVDDNLDYKSKIHDYSAFRVMHRIIDNTLCCLTGLSIIELNEARFPDPAKLAQKVRKALERDNYNLDQYVTKQGVKTETSKTEVVRQMQSVINILNENKDKNKDLFTKLVRSCNQDKKLHTLMPLNNVPDDESKILELFQLNKSTSIFQDLKNTYEIEGNITAIEEECNKSYKELEKAEQEKNKYYDENIKPLTSEKWSIIGEMPEEYFYSSSYNKIIPHNKDKDTLDENTKQTLENRLNPLQSEIDKLEKGSEYVKLKLAVGTAKGKLVANFGKIKSEFANKTKYPLAPLRPFSDKNRYGKGNSKDDDAFVCMGLYGNCVDEDYFPGTERQTRIHGFNALGLDHVVTFVDKNSGFINDPRQSIQSIRNRCFDRTHTSHYFCYSSVPLKFSPELMLKEEYITDFNKAMEEFNKRSPEELGNEILGVIDKLIKNEVSGKIGRGEKFAEIDDLAVKVIENVIASFEIVYNNKHHNAKEAQDYFAKVLEHVTSSVEKQLKKEGVTVGNLSIEHNIRGIQSAIDRIERRISGEDGIRSKDQISSEDRAVMNHIKSRMDKFTDKIDQNSKDKEEVDKKLKIKGWSIWRFIVKLVRSVIRLIFKTKLEKEKIKLVEEAKVLSQEKEKVKQEKLEFEVKIGIKGEKEVAPEVLARQKKKQEEQKEKLEAEKVELETELKTKRTSEKQQKFIGVMKKEEGVQEEKIDLEERKKIIEKQKAYNKALLEAKKQELNEISKQDKDDLGKLEELKREIKEFEELKVKIDACIDNSSTSKKPASSSHPALTPSEILKAGIDALGKTEPEKPRIRIADIVNWLNTNVKTLENTIKNDQIKTEDGQTLLKEIKDRLEILHTEKTRLEEIANKKAALEKEKDALEKVSPDKEGSKEYKEYYDNIVNKVLVYKSITNKYDLAKARWIRSVAPKFIQVMNSDYYRTLGQSNYSDYEKHMNSCVKSPIFPELFSNIVMPLYNHKVEGDGNMLLKMLNTLYPGVDNKPIVEKILELYNTMNEEKPDLDNIYTVMCYIEEIGKIVSGVMGSHYQDEECGFLKGIADDNIPKASSRKKMAAEISLPRSENHPLIRETESELKKLENEPELTAKSMLVDLVFKQIKDKFGDCASTKYLVERDPSKQEKAAFVSSKVGTMLQGVESLNIRRIVSSPDARCLNPVQEAFPADKIPSILNDMVAKQWRGEGLCIPCC